MDKVVVIGGGGFVGSHTADILSERGFDVHIFDTKESPWKKKNQNMIIGDILCKGDLDNAITGAKYVYHFAGIADIAASTEDPLTTINLNILGTSNILQSCVDMKIERLIFASTMYVYSPYGSFYRATKQSAELLIEVFSETFNLDYSLLRYGSLYGPRSQEWNGLRGYVEQVIKNGSIEYRGLGKERREYIYVRDAAGLSVDILDKNYINQAITVTGNQVMYSEEMIDMIFEIAGKEKKITYNNNPEKDLDHYLNTPYRYSPKKAMKVVPQQFLDLGEGILELIEEISN